MMNRQNLVASITADLCSRTWISLYGPRGIGKHHTTEKILYEIRQKHGDFYIVFHINFKKLRANSAKNLEEKLLNNINSMIDNKITNALDFVDALRQLHEQKQKQIILLITELDHAAKEGSEYFAKKLAQVHNQQKANGKYIITTMISSDEGTSKFIFKDTSPFRAFKRIELTELNQQETYEWLKESSYHQIKKQANIIYQQTKGYPGLIYELIKFAENNPKLDKSNLITQFVNSIIDKNNKIQCKLVEYWFKQITNPYLIEAIENLNKGVTVNKHLTGTNESAISTFGFFKVQGENVVYRNPLVESIIKHYATPLNIADHYWIMSAKYPNYWEKGRNLYLDKTQIRKEERLLDIHKVIGPNNCSMGEFVHTCCRYFDLQKDEQSVFNVLTDILYCLFDVKHYRLLRVDDNGKYKTLHEPEHSRFIEDRNILKTLINKSKETKRAWDSAWDYSYMAYPVPQIHDDDYLLVINNQGKTHLFKKDYNWSITALATKVGLTLSQLKKVKDLQILQSVFTHAEDDIRIFDDRGILKSSNSTANRNIKNIKAGEHSLITPKNIKQFLEPNIADKTTFASEVWQNNIPNKHQSHMEVSAFKFEGIENTNTHMISITRDVTLQHKMLATAMAFADTKSEKEVYEQLLQGLIEQKAKRVRIYVPDDEDTFGEFEHIDTKSKYCAGYEEQPEIKTAFENGEFDSKSIKATLEELNWGHDSKPTLCRICNDQKQITVVDDNDNAFKILKVPEQLDGYRSELNKEHTNEWLHIGLSAENKMFAMLSIDKGNNGNPFKSIEYHRMATICKAAETALARIHSLDLINLIRMFRHSIAQQLTAIGQYMWIVSDGHTSSEERIQYAETVDELIQKFELFNRNTAQLIQSKHQSLDLNLEQIELKPFLEQTKSLFKYQSKRRGIDLIIEDIPHHASNIYTHNVLLHTIIFNLIANSYAALENTKIENKQVIIRTEQKNNNIVISVIDNGIGIDSKHLDDIFKMGFSTKQSSGIGLPTCQLMAKNIGANLSLDKNYNIENQGCKFDILTPKLTEKSHESDYK